jgi:biopolymer transport protein ExbD
MGTASLATDRTLGRKALDFDLNMTPMIDLLFVTVAFLLLTAAWSHLARVDADALAPGVSGPTPPDVAPRLHVEARSDGRFTLHWNEGEAVVRSRDATRDELGAAIADEWRTSGAHRDATDRAQDELVLHAANDVPYATLIAVIDAARAVTRPCGGARCPAMRVTFASR